MRIALALAVSCLSVGCAQMSRLAPEKTGLGATPYRIGPVTVLIHPEHAVEALCQVPPPARGCYLPNSRTVVAISDPDAVLDGFRQYFRDALDRARGSAEQFVRTTLQKEGTALQASQVRDGWEVAVVAIEFSEFFGGVTERDLYLVRLNHAAQVVSHERVFRLPAQRHQGLAAAHRLPPVALLARGAAIGPRETSSPDVHRLGPVIALVRPLREVESICGAHLRKRENERILGCYLPSSETLAAVPDPLAVLHELKHHFEGNFHRADDLLRALSHSGRDLINGAPLLDTGKETLGRWLGR